MVKMSFKRMHTLKVERPFVSIENFRDLSDLDLSLGELVTEVKPMNKEFRVIDVVKDILFIEGVSVIPIVDQKDRLVGQIQTERFIRRYIFGKSGYGIHIYARRRLEELMEEPDLVLDASTKVEDVALLINKREDYRKYDDILVIDKDKYIGVVKIYQLLEAVSKKTILLAMDSNPLTKLPGNWLIKRYIEGKIEHNEAFDVIYVDINDFKPYNDNYGFSCGDRVIFALGEILKNIKEKYPQVFIGHLGGDDFVLVTPPELSEKISYEIKESFEELLPYFHKEDYEKGFYTSRDREGIERKFPLISLSLSIVSGVNRKIDSFSKLASIASEVKQATKSIAKQQGFSVVFKDRRVDELPDEHKLFSPENLDVFFQPIVDASKRRVIGFEALIRGIDREKGTLISPRALFATARAKGTLHKFDILCRELAVKKFKDYHLEKDFLLFVNISSEAIGHFLSDAEWFKEQCIYYGVDPNSVVVEIIESGVSQTESLIEFVEKHKNYGFQIAIDDFGIGHSNLERLMLIKLDFLKLGCPLVTSVDFSERKRAFLKALANFSETMGIHMVAECVENEQTAKAVKDCGIRLHQGYAYCKPLSDPIAAKSMAETTSWL